MKKLQLRFWHPIAIFAVLSVIESLIDNLIFLSTAWYIIHDLLSIAGICCLLLLIYIVVRNIIRAIKGLLARGSSSQAKELEHQREIEQKEIDMVRKSNDILIHLIQDEHRGEDR